MIYINGGGEVKFIKLSQNFERCGSFSLIEIFVNNHCFDHLLFLKCILDLENIRSYLVVNIMGN